MAILFLSRFLATKAFNADAHLIKTNIVKTNDVEAFNAGTYLNKTNIVKTNNKEPNIKNNLRQTKRTNVVLRKLARVLAIPAIAALNMVGADSLTCLLLTEGPIVVLAAKMGLALMQ
jgi:hypothetical protein